MHLRTANTDDETQTLLRALIDGQRALRDEVRALRAEVAAIKGSASSTTSRSSYTVMKLAPTTDDALVHIIAREIEDRAFSAAEVIDHARLRPTLAAALDAAGVTNARSLGHFLRAAEQRSAGADTTTAIRLTRIGSDRDGLIWRCEFVR